MYEIVYEDTAGREKRWSFASRRDPPRCVSGKFDLPDAVVIVGLHADARKLTIIREFRVPLGDYQYGFPAGLVDPGETVETSARRELQEETGLLVTRILRISPPVYSSSGMTDESVAMVYVECTGTLSAQGSTDSEDITPLLVDPRQAADLCADPGTKMDVKTWLVLSRFADTGSVL